MQIGTLTLGIKLEGLDEARAEMREFSKSLEGLVEPLAAAFEKVKLEVAIKPEQTV